MYNSGILLIFSGICHVKFGNFVNFLGQTLQNLGILLIFHAYIFRQKCLAPQSWLSSYAYANVCLILLQIYQYEARAYWDWLPVKNNYHLVIAISWCTMICQQVFAINLQIRTQQYFKVYALVSISSGGKPVENLVAILNKAWSRQNATANTNSTGHKVVFCLAVLHSCGWGCHLSTLLVFTTALRYHLYMLCRHLFLLMVFALCSHLFKKSFIVLLITYGLNY